MQFQTQCILPLDQLCHERQYYTYGEFPTEAITAYHGQRFLSAVIVGFGTGPIEFLSFQFGYVPMCTAITKKQPTANTWYAKIKHTSTAVFSNGVSVVTIQNAVTLQPEMLHMIQALRGLALGNIECSHFCEEKIF